MVREDRFIMVTESATKTVTVSNPLRLTIIFLTLVSPPFSPLYSTELEFLKSLWGLGIEEE